MEKIKIIYLTGYGKSGATLIGRHLGQSKNAFFVGELKYFWTRGVLKNYECTCGVKVDNCDIWGKVMNEYLEYFPSIDKEAISTEFVKFERLKNYFKLKKVKENNGDNDLKQFLDKYLEHNEKLYEIIAKVTGKNILVDISRIPGRLLALSFSEKLEIYPVYLMRDPRGVLNSFVQADMRYYGENRHSNFRQLITWNANTFFSIKHIKNLSPEKFLFILYSGYVRNPDEELKKLDELFNAEFNSEVKEGNVFVNLAPGHVFAGNRSRLVSGHVTIAEDTKWKKQLSWFNKLLTSILSLPLYKYIVSKYHRN